MGAWVVALGRRQLEQAVETGGGATGEMGRRGASFFQPLYAVREARSERDVGRTSGARTSKRADFSFFPNAATPPPLPLSLRRSEFLLTLFTSIFFVLLGGVFSGLSLGLMGLDSMKLHGTPSPLLLLRRPRESISDQ